jgi:hypothetical protein
MMTTVRNAAFVLLCCVFCLAGPSASAADCVLPALGDYYYGAPPEQVEAGARENCEEIDCQDLCDFAPDFDPMNCADMYCASGPGTHPTDCHVVSTTVNQQGVLIGAQDSGDCGCDYCEI